MVVFLSAHAPYLNANTLNFALYRRYGDTLVAVDAHDVRQRFAPFASRHPDLGVYVADYTRRQRGRAIAVFDLHLSDDPRLFATAIDIADYVIAPSSGHADISPSLPSTRLRDAVRALIAADSKLRLVTAVGEAGLGRWEVYRRDDPAR